MNVFIQNEARSTIKHLHNEKTLERTGTIRVARPYPYPYGFVIGTTADDGDNVDCFVLTDRKLRTGQIIVCEPAGLMEQIEDGQIDHNVLAGIRGEGGRVYPAVESELREFVSHVFDRIPGKQIRAGRFLGPEAALRHIAERTDDDRPGSDLD